MADSADAGSEFRGYVFLLWAIEEIERIDDLAELARAIREFCAADPRLPELLRRVDDRAGELLSGGEGQRRHGRTTPSGLNSPPPALPRSVALHNAAV